MVPRITPACQRLLILSLVLNLVGAAVGGLYAYKTRDVLVGWYAKYVTREPARPSPRGRYHRQRVNAFNFLEQTLEGKRLIVFAGDSLIQTFEWGEYFSIPDSDVVIVNRGIGGDTIDQLIDRSRVTFLGDHGPEKIFIMVGVNDVSEKVGEEEFSPESVARKYRALLEAASAQVAPERICVHSILPVRGKKAFMNPAIRAVNTSLESYTNRKGFCYIDAHKKFADATGQLNARYAFEDGLHLSAEGYRLWLEILTPYVLN